MPYGQLDSTLRRAQWLGIISLHHVHTPKVLLPTQKLQPDEPLDSFTDFNYTLQYCYTAPFNYMLHVTLAAQTMVAMFCSCPSAEHPLQKNKSLYHNRFKWSHLWVVIIGLMLLHFVCFLQLNKSYSFSCCLCIKY